MTYLLVNLGVLAVAVIVTAVLLRPLPHRGRALALIMVTAAVVSVFTAVFDSLMIGVGLFEYDPDQLVGLHIGLAPVEDFAYVALAALLLPALWLRLGARAPHPDTEGP